MALKFYLIPLLPILAGGNPLVKRWTAADYVGSTTSEPYPPSGTAADHDLFPPESEVGYIGGTPTGIEPLAIQTSPVYPTNDDESSTYPLYAEQPEDNPSEPFDIKRSWGLFSPWYSVPSARYGLPDANPQIPESCSITQVHILYRHGARYPTGGPPADFATKLHDTAKNGSWSSWGELDFLNTWTYKLGANILIPFGRLQNFELGVAFRQAYGGLLNNFTEAGTIPVFRTESLDRMVKTAENFAAGFFGVPEYLDQVNLDIQLEANGFNDTMAPYGVCTNGNGKPAQNGNNAGEIFLAHNFNGTVDRLNSQVDGLEFDYQDVFGMLQLCTFETVALGYSKFCHIFTEEDFRNFDYYWDVDYWYGGGPGSPISAAQGKGLLQEFHARLAHEEIKFSDSSINATLDTDPVYFPLDQSIYADATHESVLCWTLMALNLTSVFGNDPLPIDHRPDGDWTFRSSQVVPYATHLVIQVMECSETSPTKQARFILNDAVIPLHDSYPGCPWNKDGLCPLETINSVLKARIDEIDFDTACFGNYTFELGQNYNGLVPK